MMKKSVLLCQVLAAAYVASQSSRPPPPDTSDMDCCPWKVVGGKKYQLVGKSDDARDYGCSSDCTYMTQGTDIKYCFKPGMYESECYYDQGGSKPYTGMTGGPMTGGPMTGGPMTGGPMTGGPMTGGPMTGGPMTGGPMTGGPMTGGPTGGATGNPTPAPGGAQELSLEIEQTWAQEPNGYKRTALVSVPATSAGQKVPVVVTLHGSGGNANTKIWEKFLGDDCIIVAPQGYKNQWNVYSEKPKSDDVQFILDLIAKVGKEIPSADMNNVNIAGTSNGAAMTYLLMIATGADRPFKRAFPMVSSLIGPQYHDDKFWKFAQSAEEGTPNNFDVEVVPEFAADFEYAHFHGTEDQLIKYDGQDPGPALLSNAKVIAAQLTDYIWAKAMGFDGPQIPDIDGVQVGTDDKPTQEYKYLDGKCRHYKLIGEGHGTGPSHPVVQTVMREMILGN